MFSRFGSMENNERIAQLAGTLNASALKDTPVLPGFVCG